MAATQSQTVDITIRDEGSNETTFKIDAPKAGITFAEIQSTYQPILTAKLLYSRYGRAFESVTNAVVVTTIKNSLVET